MAFFEVLFYVFFTFFLYLLPHTAMSVDVCPSFSICSAFPIQFPFRLVDDNDRNNLRCGYPGFDLSCDNQSRTIIDLPYAGKFIVDSISYTGQYLWISDPENCLANRLLNFSLSNSPFSTSHLQNYTFFNCSGEADAQQFRSFSCLNGPNYTITVLPTFFAENMPSSCVDFRTVSIPEQDWRWTEDFDRFFRLSWDEPSCGSCESQGGDCEFKSSSGLDVECSNLSSSKGLSKAARYGITVGVAIPALLCIIGVASCACYRARNRRQAHHPNTTEFSTSIAPQPAALIMGLDRPTIESYPKTVLGDSKRLPEPNDGTCAICLSDYQAKETLRTIPECNHFFHARCIDEWLRLNATCPLCRNKPDGGSSHITPSSLSSNSSSQLVSSPDTLPV